MRRWEPERTITQNVKSWAKVRFRSFIRHFISPYWTIWIQVSWSEWPHWIGWTAGPSDLINVKPEALNSIFSVWVESGILYSSFQRFIYNSVYKISTLMFYVYMYRISAANRYESSSSREYILVVIDVPSIWAKEHIVYNVNWTSRTLFVSLYEYENAYMWI